jgi:plasmid stabilization system protein ParE
MTKLPVPLGQKTLVLSGPARNDISATISYVSRDAGIDKAIYLADLFDRELAKLARIGHSGASREWLSPGLRLTVIGQYSVYFRVTETKTTVVRVLMGARDLQGIDFGA